MAKRRILLVEDEENFGMVLKSFMELSGFEVIWSKNGQEGYKMIHQDQFDLCILDVMMPKMDGFELANQMNKHCPEMPYIFLTAKALKEDVLQGFRLGAVDYLSKPFDTEILVAKVNALLQSRAVVQPEKSQVESYTIGTLSYSIRSRELSQNGKALVRLSPKEAALLELLCSRKNDVLSRSEALQSIWGEESYFTTRSMDVYIAKLRKILRQDPQVEIVNLHSTGYKLKDQ